MITLYQASSSTCHVTTECPILKDITEQGLPNYVTLTFCSYICLHHQPEYSDAVENHQTAPALPAFYPLSLITSHQLLQQDQLAFSIYNYKELNYGSRSVPWAYKIMYCDKITLSHYLITAS